MEYFLLVQKEANVVKAMPELRKYTSRSSLIKPFPHMAEFGRQKYDKIVHRSLGPHRNQGIEVCYIYKGKYEWEVEGHKYLLYPGDAFITCPWELHGSPQEHLDIGIITWIIIKPKSFSRTSLLELGAWSSLSANEQRAVGHTLQHRTRHFFSSPAAGAIFNEIYSELRGTQSCYRNRVNRLVEDLLILSCRQFESRKCGRSDEGYFLKRLDEAVASRLDHPWSVGEMAGLCGMGVTTFNQRTKELTGFTPVGYLIQLRLQKAQQMLIETEESITAIAIDCGFNSPGHFSEVFRKRIGVLPKDFRKSKVTTQVPMKRSKSARGEHVEP
jgi:AraC-like DNA-binding protein